MWRFLFSMNILRYGFILVLIGVLGYMYWDYSSIKQDNINLQREIGSCRSQISNVVNDAKKLAEQNKRIQNECSERLKKLADMSAKKVKECNELLKFFEERDRRNATEKPNKVPITDDNILNELNGLFNQGS